MLIIQETIYNKQNLKQILSGTHKVLLHVFQVANYRLQVLQMCTSTNTDNTEPARFWIYRYVYRYSRM